MIQILIIDNGISIGGTSYPNNTLSFRTVQRENIDIVQILTLENKIIIEAPYTDFISSSNVPYEIAADVITDLELNNVDVGGGDPPDLTPFQPLVTYSDPPLVATNNAGTVDVNFTLLAENMVLAHEIYYRGENDNSFTLAATLDYRSYLNHVYFANLGVVPVGATLIKIRTCFINGPIQESDLVTYNS